MDDSQYWVAYYKEKLQLACEYYEAVIVQLKEQIRILEESRQTAIDDAVQKYADNLCIYR